MPERQPRRQGGATFLLLLFLVALLGVGMAALGTLWQTAAQRQKEAELLFVGDQYRRAIDSFLRAEPPGAPRRLPKTLEELLRDPRFPHTVRHLRRAYPDPITGDAEWGVLLEAGGGIAGVYSLSTRAPFKTRGFPADYAGFAEKTEYRQWHFAVADVAATARAVARADATGDAPAVDGVPDTPAAASGDARPEDGARGAPPARDPAWSARVAACQRALERDYAVCGGQAMGSGERLNTCVEVMTQRHRDCLAGG